MGPPPAEPGPNAWEGPPCWYPNDPVLRRTLEHISSACAAAGKPVGIHASDGATARLYRDGGCSLVTVATDTLAISRSAVTELAAAQA